MTKGAAALREHLETEAEGATLKYLVVGFRATEQDITPAARQQDPATTEYAAAVRRILIELVCGPGVERSSDLPSFRRQVF